MDIITGCKNDEKLRNSFCDLANKTFGLDLASWYEKGFWQDDYIPYCAVEDGNVVSNISVNVCNFKWRARVHHLAQLGTVMTDEAARGRGYSRAVMEKVLAHCDRAFEGTYLYAEEHMAGFYEKFGFTRCDEYSFTKAVNITNKANVEKIALDSDEELKRMVNIIQRRGQYGEKIMVNNPGLFMFYLTGPFNDFVYYIPSAESYAVAETDGDTLTLYAIFSDENVSLGDVISAFGSGIRKVVMGFTPANNTGFEIKKIDDKESVFFVRGEIFKGMGKFLFPYISRA